MAEHNHVVNKEGEVALNKVDDVLNRIDDSKKDDILGSFDSFKSYLSDKIEMAKKIGLNEELIAKAAEKIAGYLAAKEEPRNREEKLLQELWKAGDKEQQHALAHMLVRVAQTS
ncbi:DUF3243 domain-containing protein [Paenibacillus polymyxa]|uniref:DUF3243 domain-containing protein n=1 Tax=Paenibacillus polymyxa TaxID=1406 RepID=UPI0004D3D6F8|nr:DUF3243 domain-containing protein [Paenibacillus polymyxa]KEO78997.1 hypothetical protein EL23_11485 [Paenibacillus polymyxa]MCH6187713.1 DUF3243 domain-containing protein [Paenibacillus polymyxa]WRL57195.1 DUF3243 domain-containing protein [Paenibacillus polymyxa]